MKSFAVIVLVLLVSACASSSGGGSWKMPVDDANANPNPDSYGSDGFALRKDMPHRDDFKPWQFYYKHCAMTGEESYYSATSYDCTGPSW
jgi:hypothetical protein